MSIGLVGAHRTGKSTLARSYAEKNGIEFLETRTSAVFERMGVSPKEDYTFRVRLQIQEEILADAVRLYATAGADWISDRTPIDMLAYTLADVQRANLNHEDSERLQRYIASCFRTANMYFSTLILVQPGIKIVEEEGKAPGNPSYIEHLNSLAMGLIVDERIKAGHFYIPRSMTGLDERMDCIDSAVNMTARKASEMMKHCLVH